MTAKQLAETEALVNAEIQKGTALSFREMPIDEAKKLGAMALLEKNTAISSGWSPLVISVWNSAAVPM